MAEWRRLSGRVELWVVASSFAMVVGFALWSAAPAGAGATAVPSVRAGGVVVDPEGDTGSTMWNLPVTLSAPSAQTVTVDWATRDVPSNPAIAHPGSDYVQASGTLSFAPGETTQNIEIEVLGDTVVEPPLFNGEWGLVRLSNPTNATIDTGGFFGLGIFNIIDDDPPTIIAGTVAVDPEGDTGSAVWDLPVTLSEPSAQTVTVNWSTLDVASVPEVAHPGSDYVQGSGTLSFAPGETTQNIEIEVLGDTVDEPPLAFGGEWGLVQLSNPTNARIDTGGFFGLGVFIIIDDDPGSSCVIGATSVTTVLTQSECDALVALYNATDGPNWNDNTGWDTPTDPCDWYGVTCNATNLTVLQLSGNALSGSIPTEIGNLTGLTFLDLGINQLSGPISTQIGNLTDLTTLNLGINELSGPIPTQIGNLTNLTTLSLSNNRLSGSIPTEIGNLTGLTTLQLDSNQLTGSIPTQIGNLADLTYLDLYGNALSGSIPTEIGNLTNLTILQLALNRLSGSIPAEIGNLTNLSDLYLTSNQLTGPIPAQIENLTNLDNLELSGNQLSGSIPAEIRGLINLTNLQLDSNQLSGPIPTFIGSLTNLTYLDLSSNQLTGSIPAQIGNLTNLVVSDLYSNQLSGSIPAEIGNLTNLIALNLTDNQLSGPIPAAIGNLTNLIALPLDRNQLSGPIPAEIGNLSNLAFLHLSSNQLSGPIPTQIGNLTNLTSLDLSGNQLSGPIPAAIGNLTNLTGLYLSNNQLSGDITAAMAGVQDTVFDLDLSDGAGGNNCLTVTDGALATWLTGRDPNWDECSI